MLDLAERQAAPASAWVLVLVWVWVWVLVVVREDFEESGEPLGEAAGEPSEPDEESEDSLDPCFEDSLAALASDDEPSDLTTSTRLSLR